MSVTPTAFLMECAPPFLAELPVPLGYERLVEYFGGEDVGTVRLRWHRRTMLDDRTDISCVVSVTRFDLERIYSRKWRKELLFNKLQVANAAMIHLLKEQLAIGAP